MTAGSPSPGRMLPYGDCGLLVELADLEAVLALAAAIDTSRPPGVVDVVPAATTVLVRIDPYLTDVARVARAVRTLDIAPIVASAAVPVQIAVLYDGPDLDEVGRLTGLGAAGVVAAHTGRAWTVGFCGFMPGFGYCAGGDPRLNVPRRADPRTRVPAGSVALAGGFTGVYPRASPGGWRLIGRSDAVLWDLDRDPPALLRPGVTVRFVATSIDSADAGPR